MSEQTVQEVIGPKKHFSKSAAVGVMVAGGLMILIPWFFVSAEQGSSIHLIKTLVGVAGFVVLCVGAYYRP